MLSWPLYFGHVEAGIWQMIDSNTEHSGWRVRNVSVEMMVVSVVPPSGSPTLRLPNGTGGTQARPLPVGRGLFLVREEGPQDPTPTCTCVLHANLTLLNMFISGRCPHPFGEEGKREE